MPLVPVPNCALRPIVRKNLTSAPIPKNVKKCARTSTGTVHLGNGGHWLSRLLRRESCCKARSGLQLVRKQCSCVRVRWTRTCPSLRATRTRRTCCRLAATTWPTENVMVKPMRPTARRASRLGRLLKRGQRRGSRSRTFVRRIRGQGNARLHDVCHSRRRGRLYEQRVLGQAVARCRPVKLSKEWAMCNASNRLDAGAHHHLRLEKGGGLL